MTLVSGDSDKAKTLAGQVRALCESRLEHGSPDDYWLRATLGEVSLLLGHPGEATKWYAKAARLAGNRFGDIASMRPPSINPFRLPDRR